MAHERLRPQYFFDEEKIKQLKQIAPECFEDGKINFETLKQNLGDWVQDEDDMELEHFGLFWPGKKDARKIAAIPPQGTLEPVYGEGLKADGTPDTDGENDSKNIFIEGENLEVLKILQKSYAGKIKIIYIDPPYNTGEDFVYDDNFTEPIEEYLRRTGQVDEEGKPLTTNKKSDGRFHSKWLSMMYPRLRLARNLLREDGVTFISIDDNEIHNLRAICNEIFGEENFVSELIWEKKKKGTFLSNTITNVKEYVVVFCKNKESFNGLIGEINEDEETYPCINASNKRSVITIPKGIPSKYKEKDFILEKGNEISASTMSLTLHSDLVLKDGKLDTDLVIEGNWRYNSHSMTEYAENGELYVTQDLYLRRIVKEPRQKTLKDLLSRVGDNEDSDFRDFNIDKLFSDGWGSNEDGVEELRQLFGIDRLMDYPKPVKLICKLIASVKDKNALILDFFAGSATLAQAVMTVNSKDNGERKYILIQLPEVPNHNSEAFRHGYRSLAKLASDRIKKSIEKYNYLKGNGFKYFKLNKSNFKLWHQFEGASLNDLNDHLDLFNQNSLNTEWNYQRLLSEIRLIEGFTLSSTILDQKDFFKNNVVKIFDEFTKHSLLICFDEKVYEDTIDRIELSDNKIFICLDNALTSAQKLRLSDKGMLKTI